MLIAVVICVVSVPTVSCTGVAGGALARFNVTPGMTPATVLLALLTGTPSTVKEALLPAVVLKCKPATVLLVMLMLPVDLRYC